MAEMVMLRVASGHIVIISALKVSICAVLDARYYNIEWLLERSSGAVVVIIATSNFSIVLGNGN